MMSGVVLSVDVVEAGVDVLEPADVGETFVVGVDAFDLPTGGGVVELPDGSVVDYAAANHDSDVVTFAAPLTVALVEGDRLLVRPRRSYTEATVRLEGEGGTIPVRVPHTMQSSLPTGVRVDPEPVSVEVREDGSFWVYEVHDRPPLEVWGDPDGAAAEMSDTGLSFFTVGPNGRYEATRLGSGQDRLAVNNADGQIIGGVTADGSLVGQSGVIAGDFSVGGTPLMGRLWDNSPGAPVGWFERFAAGDVASAFFDEFHPRRATGEEWGYAKIGFTARAGRSYVVLVTCGASAGAIGGSIRTRLRYTTDGSEPTITSPMIGGTSDNTGASASVGNTMTAQSRGRLSFAADTDVRVMVTYQGLIGGEPEMQRAYFEVQDLGPQGTYGGGTYTTGREATPPPTVREYTSTWVATGFRVYDESGQPDTTAMQPTQWAATDDSPDRTYSAIAFTGGAATGEDTGDTITDALDGATLTKAEVFLMNTSWFTRDDGEVALGKGGFSDLPPTLTDPQATVKPTGWPTGAGQWVQVPVAWFNDSNRVITLGDVDNAVHAGWFMAPTDEFPPQARLTYTR